MLRHLKVSNYALIDRLEVDFSQGLCVITGETGAGKSILIGALGLVLGQRADVKALQDKSRKCIVEGIFGVKEYHLQEFFEANDLDYDHETTVRREINPAGKSRAFINDTPVNLNVLKEFGSRLVDIHSQHETLSLNESAFQVEVLDAYAGIEKLAGQYKNEYRDYRAAEKELADIKEQEGSAKSDLDYFQFQHKELEEAALTDGEQEELEAELKTLEHAEQIKGGISEAVEVLSYGQANALGQLRRALAVLKQAAAYHQQVQELSTRMESTSIELQDIASELELLQGRVEHNPVRTEQLTQRLNLIYALQQKHRVQTVKELLELKTSLEKKITGITSLDDNIARLEKEVEEKHKTATKSAEQISTQRGQAIPSFEKEVNRLLKQLGMPAARLKIEKEKQETLGPQGKDAISYLFSANKGTEYMEMKKVASGGELNRLMLSIKSIVARLAAMPTVIFDEIDTGVSGEIADKVGNTLRAMSEALQVISITHLPQIAVKGHSHLLVYKESDKTTTRSAIRELKGEERVEHIARMLSGEELTDAAMKNARVLLKN